ncbi:DUF4424 family protein [Citromicrobium bathyomarinum]|uniref:DUF4424 family protein n=1 Tax=Citromicrobium bathyomarinum TaxID=72174 RepID=UPI0031599B76
MIFSRLLPRAVILAAAGFLLASPIAANDSEAEIGLGGIELKPSSALRMLKEDLYVSADLVRVDYVFENPTDEYITTTIAFPMPSQPRGLAARDMYYDNTENWSGFDFATHVDGRPLRLQQLDRAMIGDRDVTDAVAERGWPMAWAYADELNPFASLSETEREALVTEGWAVRDPLFGNEAVPAWDKVTYFVREQTFEPNSTVAVRHEYVPLVGGSAGSALYPQYRSEDADSILAEYRTKYCLDDGIVAGIDRRVANPGGDEEMQTYMGETWLNYVLSSGANWDGPIRDFRLVVDKGSPDNLVSFCMDGVKKIGPTQFEVVKKDFEPTRDLEVLIVSFFRYD